MASFNKVILAGNLGADPELRSTPSGTYVAALRLAVNRFWKNKEGEQQEETTFVDVTAFQKSAETICKHLTKGSPILIEGRLKQESWQDKETGGNRYKMVVILESFQFIGGGSKKASDGDADEDLPF